LRLDCDTGFGTASFVTGAFGLIAASRIVRKISES
jgi:tRNA A37 threonylcarbamoyladenosine dehydratase